MLVATPTTPPGVLGDARTRHALRTNGYKHAQDLHLPDALMHAACELGEGSFGTVYLTHTARPYAVKRGKRCDDGMPFDIAREVVAHRTLGPHHAIALMTASYPLSGAVVYEPMTTSLKRVVAAHGPVPEEPALTVTAQLCDALAHCHSHGILHRDVSCNNVLVDPGSWRAVLTDFGVCHFVAGTRSPSNESTGMFFFRAPEVLRGEWYSYASDVWSVGVLHLYMRLGHLPFAAPTQRPEDQLAILARGVAHYFGRLSAYDNGVVVMALELDPNQRSAPGNIAACARMMLGAGRPSVFPWLAPPTPPPSPGLFGWDHGELRPFMRPIVVEWMLEVGMARGVCIAAMMQAAHALDRFVTCHRVTKKYLQAVGACCLVVCSKLIDYGLTLADVKYFSADAFTLEELQYFEALVLEDVRLDPIPDALTDLPDRRALASMFIPRAFGRGDVTTAELDAAAERSATLRKKTAPP